MKHRLIIETPLIASSTLRFMALVNVSTTHKNYLSVHLLVFLVNTADLQRSSDMFLWQKEVC